ncbi:zinc-binding dehydrogenase [Leucobacter sp. HY1908]
MTIDGVEHMRAAFVREAGPADSIVVGDVPIPRPGPGSVLVQSTVMAVNHVDTFIRSGAYATARPAAAGEPFVIGRDIAGTVAQVGPGVTGFKVGDSVWCNSLGYDGRQGSFSEFALVPVERLYALPAGVAPEAVATVSHTAATAYLGLVREAGLLVGETVFVGGAAGGVGSAAVQLAHAMGARVLASCSPHDADWVRACGADEVFDRTDAALLDRVYAAAPDGVNVWWDTTGRLDLAASLRLMARGGRVIVSAGLAGASSNAAPGGTSAAAGAAGGTISPTDFYTRDIQLRGFVISNASVAELAAAAAAINSMLARGQLKGRVAKVLTLEEAAGAHRLMESHAAPGKLLVKPGTARPKPHAPAPRSTSAEALKPAAPSAKPAGPTAPTGPTPKPGPKPTPHPTESAGTVSAAAPKPGPKPVAPKPAAPNPSN